MARVLIVGCGCRGQALARSLVADGLAVRATTRDQRRIADIEAAGAEPYIGDPDRIMTLMDALSATTIVCWLMGTAASEPLHGGRLRMLTEKLVDTPVRGLVYEAGGTIPLAWREQGELIARAARATWNIPLEVLTADPADHDAWLGAAVAAVGRLLDPVE